MRWRNFKTDPPYDAYENYEAGMETDFVWAWFVYRYTNRPDLNGKTFVSHWACRFSQGVFEQYKSGMKTSPYPEDRIEVLAWIDQADVHKVLQDSFNEECERRLKACKGWEI